MHHCKLTPYVLPVLPQPTCECYDNLVTTLLEYCICCIICMQTVFLYELICLINEGGVPEDIAIAMKTLKGTCISIAVI